jgi:predicted DNA-binding transcriptional regulator YafY
MDRLERLINLVIALRETRRALTADQIRTQVAGYGQEDHQAFRRMFERDKADLRALGVPVDTAPLDRWGDEVGYRIDAQRYDLPPVSFDPEELAALALAVQATGLGDSAAAGLRKLAVGAGQALGEAGPADVTIPVAVPHWLPLAEAQASRTTVRFAYRRPGHAAQERTVDPHALVHRRGQWYLVGRDHSRDAARAFRLDRIDGSVRKLGEPGAFDDPPTVTTDDVLPQPGPGPEFAEVAAAPALAWQVARRARGGGRELADGWSAFTVPVGDPDRFVTWVLGHGPELVVLGPADLRQRVVAALEGLAR